ncbi:MAG: hypothetical protein F7C82_06245 [Desulfurococcales archaeon]|nr:hypothetical protein [Desulfurococcales archaeon]MCE4623096.1 hypothetical protein [Desulfurococcales archaeon]MCE4626346.1 hypothetical protein [Desulfurococcales archaeon]MCE4629861.1 hypothetical protein [Desulfurococcales archaeon]
MTGKVVVEVDLGKYKNVELPLEEAERLLSIVTDKLGFESSDVNEAYRIMRNFDVFHETQKKKFKDYLVPSKSMNDMILGRVIVDKVKLVKEGNKKIVVLSFDRRVPVEVVVEALKDMGYEVEVKEYSLA